MFDDDPRTPTLRNATVVVLDDPQAGKKAILAFSTDGCFYMQCDLADESACRRISLAQLRMFAEDDAMKVNPTFAKMMLAELASVEGLH